MNLNRDIANADAYIARASKDIEKQRRLLTGTRNPQTAARVQNLLDVLATLLANVQHKRETLTDGGQSLSEVRRPAHWTH